MEGLIGRPITTATKKYVVPGFLKAIGYGPEAASQAANYTANIASGVVHKTSQIERCFTPMAQQTYDAVVTQKQRDKLNDWIEGGGINNEIQPQSQSQGFAEGGVTAEPTKPVDHLSGLFPEQATLLSAAKGRVSNYLNSIRPLPNQTKLAFDEENPNTAQKRSYDKALDMAIKPLAILNQVRDGSIDVEDLKHAQALYPEMMDDLRKQMTVRITKAQMDGEKPVYKVRQAMSAFMGTPLDSTLTPVAIQAAQSVFAPQPSPQAAPGPKQKKTKGSLTKLADSYQTDSQARVQRGQKG
jgi:hypothetical protein